MKSKSKRDQATGEVTFEHSMHRLEEIVDRLERGEVSLDESLKLFEEGMEISRSCLNKLSAAETRLKSLSKDMNGKFTIIDVEQEE
jgi:exodeoxyribonuclease VII small subunit